MPEPQHRPTGTPHRPRGHAKTPSCPGQTRQETGRRRRRMARGQPAEYDVGKSDANSRGGSVRPDCRSGGRPFSCLAVPCLDFLALPWPVVIGRSTSDVTPGTHEALHKSPRRSDIEELRLSHRHSGDRMGQQRTLAGLAWSAKGRVIRREQLIWTVRRSPSHWWRASWRTLSAPLTSTSWGRPCSRTRCTTPPTPVAPTHAGAVPRAVEAVERCRRRRTTPPSG